MILSLVAAIPTPALTRPFELAQSAEALALRHLLRKALGRDVADTSVSLGEPLRELQAIQSEAATEDWDGYGAMPVSPAAVERARAFLELLPATAPTPDVYADTDGDVLIEWHLGNNILTLSIDATTKVNYAATFGEDSEYGKATVADAIPRTIVVWLQRLATTQTAVRRIGA